jgi:hypothetical protein
MALSATLEESTGASPEEASSDQPFPLRLGQSQPDDPAGQETASPGSLDGLSAISALPAAGSGLEAERREWTAATTVRYPLYDASRPGLGDGAAFPSPATASSLGFLDVGRVATPAATSLRVGTPAWAPSELAGTSSQPDSLETDFATDFSTHAPVVQKPSTLAASRLPPSLTGESRGARMMLLASAGRRLRDRVSASPLPVARESPEIPNVQPQGQDRAKDSGGDTGRPDTERAEAAIPHRLEWANRPLADDRASRSAIEGIAVLMLLAAEWFTKSHARLQQGQRELPNSCPLDSRQIAARDRFFERLFAP